MGTKTNWLDFEVKGHSHSYTTYGQMSTLEGVCSPVHGMCPTHQIQIHVTTMTFSSSWLQSSSSSATIMMNQNSHKYFPHSCDNCFPAKAYRSTVFRRSCGVITKVGVTRDGSWWCDLFFPQKKNWWPFLVITVCKLMTFLAVPCPHHSHLPTSLNLSSVLVFFSNFSHKRKLILFRCRPLYGVTRGGPPSPPSDATASETV